jgi:site-specific recombinase XerC
MALTATPQAASPTTAETAVEPLSELVAEFFLARRPKKHSEHTLAAYRRDLDVITVALAEVLSCPADKITIDQLHVRTLRRAFAAISHQSAATISRTWSTWNQLFTFLVARWQQWRNHGFRRADRSRSRVTTASVSCSK